MNMGMYDTNLTNDLNMSDFKDLPHKNKLVKQRDNEKKFHFSAKLGEVINNNIKYFGQYKIVDYKHTAAFICPKCNELFRANVKHIMDGRIKHCKKCK